MPKLYGQFHVDFPINSKIRFATLLDGKDSPIFIESLSDSYVHFHSFLDLPIEFKGEQVIYLFDISFLGEQFQLKGKLEEVLEDGFVKKYEASFIVTQQERSEIYRLLNQFQIIMRGIAKNRKKEPEEKKVKKSPYFSRRV